jgi:MFS family permease
MRTAGGLVLGVTVPPGATPTSDAGRVAALVGLLFGLAGMGSAAVAVTLPAIAADLGLTTGGSAWIISLYALMLAVATAVYGRIADLAGIRLPLTIGVGLMASGAVVGALAPSYPVLLAARLLQGAGAASVPVLGMAIVSAKYDGSIRTAALGRVAGTAAAVTALGPLAGGGVADLLSWRAVVAFPALGLLVVPVLWRAIPTTGSGARLDLLGAGLVALTAAGLVLLVQSPSAGAVVAVAGALLLTLGVPSVAAQVRRRPQGFLPLVVVRNSTVVRSALSSSAVPAAWFALLIAVPVVLVSRGWSPLQVGLALVPSAATGLLAPKLAAPVLVRLGAARSLAVSGSLAALALVVAAGGASLASPAAAAPVLVLAVMLVTFAFGLGQPALMAAVSDAVPAEVRGVALGIATLVFLVGGGVGSAVVGGLAEVVGMRPSLLLLTLLPLGGVLVVLPRRAVLVRQL